MAPNKKTSKIATIISHEYMTRLKSKGFIISTIFGPLIVLLFFGIIALVALMSKDSTERKIAILDKTGTIGKMIVENDSSKYYITHKDEAELRDQVLKKTLDGYLVIPKDFIKSGVANVYSPGGGGIGFVSSLNRNLRMVLRQERMINAGLDPKIISEVMRPPVIKQNKITEEGTEKDYAEVFAILGYFLGFGIYMMMFIYGAMVMRGVIEEKTNRIVEVIASSAKPFEIMMGKVVGIGLLGLTQMLIWTSLAIIVLLIKGSLITSLFLPQSALTSGALTSTQATMLFIKNIPMPSGWIFAAFIFYFLTGFFIYATLFAAIGSAVDQESDAQQLQLPVTLPIIIPMLFISYIIQNPEGTLSVVLSLFPMFSPILMMVRIAASDVPLWQVILSVLLMIGTFFLAVWLASRIYRVGILMYGRKPKLKDLLKWARVK